MLSMAGNVVFFSPVVRFGCKLLFVKQTRRNQCMMFVLCTVSQSLIKALCSNYPVPLQLCVKLLFTRSKPLRSLSHTPSPLARNILSLFNSMDDHIL